MATEIIVRVTSVKKQIKGELVAPLVRCKDCRFWQKLLINDDGEGVCRAGNRVVVCGAAWFCAGGKEKEEGEGTSA